jgi:hypothetical protein
MDAPIKIWSFCNVYLCLHQQNWCFDRKKITKDGCKGEKIFARLKTVLCVFVYLCAI